MSHFSQPYQGQTKALFVTVVGFALLLVLAGCGEQKNNTLETYHDEDYGFSISVDKELMEYIEIEKEVMEGSKEVALHFVYVKEEQDPDTNEVSFLTWGRFFTILIVPVGAEPQDSRYQMMGSNQQYSFYFATMDDTPIISTIVHERYKQYEEMINKVPSTFSVDK